MKPIWYFVGLVLMTMGVIVLAADFLSKPSGTVLAHLRPNLWWSAVMVVAGAAFYFANRNATVD